MSRCSDSRELSELDTVTFFIVTELMAIDRERKLSARSDEDGVATFEFPIRKIA